MSDDDVRGVVNEESNVKSQCDFLLSHKLLRALTVLLNSCGRVTVTALAAPLVTLEVMKN